jgi:polysaccharide chain length determinant protein (PEP-CTERM system associated)
MSESTDNRGDQVRTLVDYTELIRRRWVYPATIVPGVILAAFVLAYTLPTMYRSSATILVAQSSIPEDMVRTTVTGLADQQFELVRRDVMIRSRLAEVVRQTDPYPQLRDATVEEKAALIISNTSVERVDPVTLEPLLESNAFSIHYENPNPERAAAVAEKLAELFLTYNRENRTKQAEQTFEFLRSNAQQLEETVQKLDVRIADFKRKNANALPEDLSTLRSSLEREESSLDGIEAQARLAENRESTLAVQLSQLNPTLVGAVSDTRTELATLRAELTDAEQRYSEDHPDVKRLRRAVAALAAQAPKGGGDIAPGADNPEYLRVAAELEAARRDVRALRAQAARIRSTIYTYQSRMVSVPSVEREYLQLIRDRDIAQNQLQEVQGKLRDAQFAQALEAEQRGERYTLIRAPYVPEDPVRPNRLGILLLGFILAAGVSIGCAVVADIADSTIRSTRDVDEITDVPILGSIPKIANAEDGRRRRIIFGRVCVAYAAAAVVFVAVVALVAR